MIRLGIDVGSLFIKIYGVHNGQRIELYSPHKGDYLKFIEREILPLLKQNQVVITVTGRYAEGISQIFGFRQVDNVSALLRSVLSFYPDVRHIVDMGSGSVSLINLDERGKFKGYVTNTICAAGTGSFLDEQMRRLELDYETIKQFPIVKDPPSIASRCAVFAKSDIVHFQQEGYSKEALWSGLSRGMVSIMLQSLLKGKGLCGLTVVTGGVTLNRSVMYWLRKLSDAPIRSFELAPLSGAHGAFIIGEEGEDRDLENDPVDVERWTLLDNSSREKKRPRLLPKRSYFPEYRPISQCINPDGTEVRIHHYFKGGTVPVFLGIDIGSTSTKAVLVDENEKIIVDLYRRTSGEPVEATKKLFGALLQLEREKEVKFKVLGCGTTGSGRKLIGKLTGADIIKNEITAHARGALSVDPGIDTIFEIGGQDSKYMRIEKGNTLDSNLNYVCAAGTGSFVEEQAKKLGFSINEVGDAVLGIAPAVTSDRCTVFMEQDVLELLRRGYDKKEAMASVCYSVIENYLNKVVGNRYISPRRILFLGATARNKGLVAAIENLLNVEVVVSPFSHVMGAYGMALLSKEYMAIREGESGFRGFELANKKVNRTEESCRICSNHCKIIYLKIEGEDERPSFGYMCGREPEEKRAKNLDKMLLYHKGERLLTSTYTEPYSLKRKEKIGVPMCLSIYGYLPFFRTFFESLGFEIVLTGKTDPPKKKRALDAVGSEYCCPVKFAHGHIWELLLRDDVDYVFYPLFVSDERDSSNFPNYFFCPLNIGLSCMLRNSMSEKFKEKFLAPLIDHRFSFRVMVRNLRDTLGSKLKIGEEEIVSALKRAYFAQKEFKRRLYEEGGKALRELKEKDEVGLVILGRPYNIFDTGINLSIPLRVANLGFKVIPMSFVPFDSVKLDGILKHMYWKYGQDIVRCAHLIKEEENLFPLYLSNFNCGPDSFLLTYLEEIFRGKPFLVLELDEHGADAGYVTRIEAFADVVKSFVKRRKETSHLAKPRPGEDSIREMVYIKSPPEDFGRKIVWIPAIHVYGTPLFAAAFRAYGYEALPIPPEDIRDLEVGRRLTRGNECLPATLTLGSFINAVNRYGYKREKHALFMATATGPCRFGQYCILHRIILNRIGWDDVPIMSPSSSNTYSGLKEGLRRYLWKVILTADILFKLGCKFRPYEKRKGEVNGFLDESVKRLIKIIEKREDLEEGLKQIALDMSRMDIRREKKPLAGVVGEIYVRSNGFSNQYVVDSIERNGGEVWLTPVSEWFLYTAFMERWNSMNNGQGLIEKIRISLKNRFLKRLEGKFYNLVSPLLDDRVEPDIEEVLEAAKRYSLQEFQGEATLTVGRSVLFLEQGASLVVNCSPFGCMPGSLASGVLNFIQEKFDRPFVNMFYDGEVDVNQVLAFYLRNL